MQRLKQTDDLLQTEIRAIVDALILPKSNKIALPDSEAKKWYLAHKCGDERGAFLTIRELGQKLGRPTSTIHKHIHRVDAAVSDYLAANPQTIEHRVPSAPLEGRLRHSVSCHSGARCWALANSTAQSVVGF